jgi:hypothetical protein
LNETSVGITLNDSRDWYNSDDATLLAKCATSAAPRVFLGEQYWNGCVANSPGNVAKLQQAFALYSDSRAGHAPSYTTRQFASLIGLMLFMAHTINIDLHEVFTLLRAYGAIIADATGWDHPCRISSTSVHQQLEALALRLSTNEAVPLPTLHSPSLNIARYDAAIIVDASACGWGAYVRFSHDGSTFALRQRWSTRMAHAALLAIQWARAQHPNAFIALVTDHSALATGQRRWNSRFGGFSTSYHLNELYRELYSRGSGEIFFVIGSLNPADGPSRDPTALSLTARPEPFTFPALSTFSHPHATITRAPHQV